MKDLDAVHGRLDATLLVKLGSLVVHADELTAEGFFCYPDSAAAFDHGALRQLIEDPDVAGWLELFPDGLLPVKRGGGPGE